MSATLGPRVLNLDDIRTLARRRLPRMVFDFIDGGVDDEKGLRRNRDAFDRWQLLPRFLTGADQRDLSVELLGRTYSTPIGISPMGLASLFRRDGDVLMARAAVAANIPFVLSGSSNASLERIAKVAPDHAWFQLYCTRDEAINHDLIDRAASAGLRTLVLTVDVAVNSNRERNLRNGFVRPFRFTPSMLLQGLAHPGWALDHLRGGGHPMMENWQPYAPAGATANQVADLFGQLTPSAASTWETFRNARRWWSGKLLIKGLLHPDDARRAVDMGADGVIVSNHGARQLDAAPSPLTVLPAIRAAVPDTVLILDSGVRRGSDIVIAMCHGANFALCGRPMMFAVAAAGTEGVQRAVRILHVEVDKVLAQMGCRHLGELHSGQLMAASADSLS